jgi:IS30 family transposase
MGRGKKLKLTKRALVDELHSLNLSQREIGRRNNRSQHVLRVNLEKGRDYGKKIVTKGSTKVLNRQKKSNSPAGTNR